MPTNESRKIKATIFEDDDGFLAESKEPFGSAREPSAKAAISDLWRRLLKHPKFPPPA